MPDTQTSDSAQTSEGTTKSENDSAFEVHDHNTCPDCGGDLDFVDAHGDYTCTYCINAVRSNQ